ncbi:MAG TPA: L-glutamate gamma-semialdehyde dehydrogenase [Burkholderiales bacterium]|nr:L-glutamate gamma-semialdehyde dehydrogenase [Burkholderiales bacterium]
MIILPELLAELRRQHRLPEAKAVAELLAAAPAASEAVEAMALRLARRVRDAPPGALSAESFLRQYGLSTPEGIALMCVAEALLRIPDAATADALLRERLAQGDWGGAQGATLLAHAAEWALLLTGTLARWHDAPSPLKHLVARLGEPVVRTAVRHAMHILAEQFVLAETIDEAVQHAERYRPYRFSFDMLGEAARTGEDADRYFALYARAIDATRAPDGLSIKLSALHPRFEEAKRSRIFAELLPRLRTLFQRAAARDVSLTIDAEESERLELTLDLHAALADDFAPGLAVQAYQKRALAVCEWLASLGRATRRRLPIRLVKGAYWDGEIKRTQQLGLEDYPVFTRKAATDLSYLACARLLLAEPAAIYPAFATHNTYSVAAILDMAGEAELEFQKLLGMGDALYAALLAERETRVRVYAPVGRFADLLPYLVRRMLENGANTSFVHQIADPEVPLAELVADPRSRLPDPYVPGPRIPLPRHLYPDRLNSLGVDLSRRDVLDTLQAQIRSASLSRAQETSTQELDRLVARAQEAFAAWARVSPDARACRLEAAAQLMEERIGELVALIVREGRRTYADAVAEVREAADFCRYYALRARRDFAVQRLPGPAGESNELGLHGRGVFACISPWNFPLAIFTGQVAAALAAGNAVLAKPAEQTPLTGRRAVELLWQAGIPRDALACVVGDGERIGAPLVADERIAGVAFTGSVETAQRIHRALAARSGAIVPLIAETGGVNAMLVDASALPEQVVDDTVISAFQSAGQRCSAQRLLFLDEESAPRTLRLLAGALAELKVGDPTEPDTDIGPIIDAQALATLERHVARLRRSARLIGEAPPPQLSGNFLRPVAFELALEDLPRTEIFGPVLHVCLYRRQDLGKVLSWLRATGYGLTLGIHSRIQGFIDEVVRETRVGNTYVNRSMIGAVVGVQPFGGEGLSGTGPKAGGPHYLPRFATERTLTVNTAAVGGVTELLSSEGG